LKQAVSPLYEIDLFLILIYNILPIVFTRTPAHKGHLAKKFRQVISQASCRRLPAFQFHCRLTGIDDLIAGNYVTIQADFIFLSVRL